MRKAVLLNAQVYYVSRAIQLETALKESIEDVLSNQSVYITI